MPFAVLDCGGFALTDTIYKVEGTSAQLEELRQVISGRQLNQSSLLPAIDEAIEQAKAVGTAEVDETELTDRAASIMYRTWASLGHGRYRPLGEAYTRCPMNTW